MGLATRYSAVAMLLHWAIAIAVIVNWRIAAAAEQLEGTARAAVMANHFALGITILVLTVARIAWRLLHPPPPLAAHLRPWERWLAKTSHALFYILLITLPMLGWIAMSLRGVAIDVWGLAWPVLPVGSAPETASTLFDIHATLGIAMLVLIVLHVAGSLKHTLVDRDGNLWRMVPGIGRPRA